MNCPPARTNAYGIFADSVASGVPAFDGVTGSGPVNPGGVGRVGLVDGNIYRLTGTTPTA